jgi:hypothetical protein
VCFEFVRLLLARLELASDTTQVEIIRYSTPDCQGRHVGLNNMRPLYWFFIAGPGKQSLRGEGGSHFTLAGVPLHFTYHMDPQWSVEKMLPYTNGPVGCVQQSNTQHLTANSVGATCVFRFVGPCAPAFHKLRDSIPTTTSFPPPTRRYRRFPGERGWCGERQPPAQGARGGREPPREAKKTEGVNAEGPAGGQGWVLPFSTTAP